MSLSKTASPLRSAGSLLVWCYLLALRGVAPVAAGVLSMVEGSHDVQIAVSGGEVDLVLHHEHEHEHAHDASAAGHHSHGCATALVVMLADHDCDHNDHVIHFASSDHVAGSAAAALNVIVAPDFVPAAGLGGQVRALPCEERILAYTARPPPRESALAVCLRTTLLVV